MDREFTDDKLSAFDMFAVHLSRMMLSISNGMCERKITQTGPPCKLLRFIGYFRYCPGFRDSAIPTLHVSPESLKFMSHYQLRHIELVFKGPSE